MIDLYTGTPGSGKSLHLADKIIWATKMHKYVIGNFPVYLKKNKQYYIYKDNSELTVQFLIDFYHDLRIKKGREIGEDEILLIIDECQIMFNAREWGQSDRAEWIKFFTQHRKLGYHVILVAQFDLMIDKQLRSLVEYQHIHRKVSNFGWRGWLLCALMLSPRLFVDVIIWYPMREKTSSEFFRFHFRNARIYDTKSTFEIFDSSCYDEDAYLTDVF